MEDIFKAAVIDYDKTQSEPGSSITDSGFRLPSYNGKKQRVAIWLAHRIFNHYHPESNVDLFSPKEQLLQAKMFYKDFQRTLRQVYTDAALANIVRPGFLDNIS